MADQDNRGFSSAAKLAQAGHAIATILNGAITGGLHVAAIAAAKAFAPQIIKIVAFVLLLANLLPFFLFLSLVGPNFHFPSVDDPDVVKMNEQAALVGGLYRQFGTFTRNEADAIIARLSAGYDDTVVKPTTTGLRRFPPFSMTRTYIISASQRFASWCVTTSNTATGWRFTTTMTMMTTTTHIIVFT